MASAPAEKADAVVDAEVAIPGNGDVEAGEAVRHGVQDAGGAVNSAIGEGAGAIQRGIGRGGV